MNTWGLINSFGLFQAYYSTLMPDLAPSTISWIGSLQVFLLFFVGTFTGRMTDAGYFRPLFFFGSVLQLASVLATSFCTRYWHFILSQGIVQGLANGCLFCPSLALLATYFTRRRGLAIGLSACGSATGGLVFPAMARELLPRIGFGWTLRAILLVEAVTLAAANFLLRPRVKPRKQGGIVEWAAFREHEYSLYAAGGFFCYWGVYFAFYYLAAFARSTNPTALGDGALSYVDSLNLLLLLNGIGVIGRLLPNHVADRVGSVNVFIPVAFAAGLIVLCWIAVHTASGLYVWAIFYGIAAGGIQSLFPAGLSSLTADPRKQGVRLGMVFTIVSLAVLTGPPIAGAIIAAEGGGYSGAQGFAGAVLLLGMLFMVAAKMARSRREGAKGFWKEKV